MRVFLTRSHWNSVHLDRECLERELTRIGISHDRITDMEVDETFNGRFCRLCSPPVLHPTPVLHTTCVVCRHVKPMPCPHNGGVLTIGMHRTRSGVRRPFKKWRWPENVRGATVAEVDEQS